MSVTLKTDGMEEEVNISNGEWAALTAMAAEFGILGNKWSGYHHGEVYNSKDILEMSKRAEQIGKAASWLKELAATGKDVKLS